MKFGYTIIYVADVKATLDFFVLAFGFSIRFLHEPDYGELDTGETLLAFASHGMGKNNLSQGYVPVQVSGPPLGIELAFVTPDVATAHGKALAAGALALAEPALKPWGQTVSYVKTPDGILVELCTPVPV